jgi:putative membrane protein
MWGNHNGAGAAHWLGMGLIMLLALALVVALIFVVVRFSTHGRPSSYYGAGPRSFDRAEAMLAERFARGDINAEEYQGRRDVLRDRP